MTGFFISYAKREIREVPDLLIILPSSSTTSAPVKIQST